MRRIVVCTRGGLAACLTAGVVGAQAESFILDPEELEEERVLDTSKFLLSSSEGGESPDLQGSVDPDTQARLEALLEATGGPGRGGRRRWG